MGEWKAKQPRARVPVCWVCDKQLYAGGRAYVRMVDPIGVERAVHGTCEEEAYRDGLERVDGGLVAPPAHQGRD